MHEKHIEELDACGLRCPLPLLKMRQALRQLPTGACLRVLANDVGSAKDIPHWLESSEHQLLELTQEGEQLMFLVRVGDRP